MTEAKKPHKSVRLFFTPSCPYCFTLKEFLKEHQIDFEDIDVSQDEKAREEMVAKSGKMEVPVLEIGNEIVAGFDREKICKLLDIQD